MSLDSLFIIMLTRKAVIALKAIQGITSGHTLRLCQVNSVKQKCEGKV